MKGNTLRVLQLAAFCSNTGDNANISGIRAELSRNLSPYVLEFHDWDLVDFSWDLNQFDDDALSYINSFDLFIIGGGGFLEIIPGATTWTGTRINIPKEVFRKISVPTVLYALGIDTVRADLDGRPIDNEISKFRTFIDFISSVDNFLLSTRHDGSMSVLNNLIGEEYANQFSLIGDGGFFSTYKDFFHPELEQDKINIAINFGGDLIDARFKPDYPCDVKRNNPLGTTRPPDYEQVQYGGHRGYTKFLISFSNVLRRVSFHFGNCNFIFIPHIYRDIEVGYDLLSETGFPYCRREMVMAPYIQGFSAKDYLVDLYSKCDLAIGMRFHANVCPIGLGTPSIGLGTFPMIKHLYSSLGIDEQYIEASAGDEFEEKLFQLVLESLSRSDGIRERYKEVVGDVQETTATFHARILKLVEDGLKVKG